MTIRNLEFVLRPRSIAVIGASNNAGSVGHTLTENVLAGGQSLSGSGGGLGPEEELDALGA